MGVRLARMIQRNGSFEDWHTGGLRPVWWLKYSQSSLWQSTHAHSAAQAIRLDVYSASGGNCFVQFPDGRDEYGASVEPMDYFWDGIQHRIKAVSWCRNVNVTSGSLRLRVTTHASSTGLSDFIPYNTSWHHLETSEVSFIGSNYLYVGMTRTSNEHAGQFYLSEMAALLDEIELHTEDASVPKGRREGYRGKTNLGSPYQHLYSVDGWRLRATGVTSSQLHHLRAWHAGGHPLLLRTAADSGPTPPFSLSLPGRKAVVARIETDLDLHEVTLELESV